MTVAGDKSHAISDGSKATRNPGNRLQSITRPTSSSRETWKGQSMVCGGSFVSVEVLAVSENRRTDQSSGAIDATSSESLNDRTQVYLYQRQDQASDRREDLL